SGINHDGKIRSAAYLVDVIDQVIGAAVKVRGGHARQMSASRETQQTHLLLIEVPFFGLAADETHGTLGVLKRMLGVLAALGNAVFQHDARDADLVEPRRYV